MRKRNLLQFYLFNSLSLLAVPATCHAALDAPLPDPIPFALTNLVSFPEYLTLDESLSSRWRLAVGGARLFGMPEIQPFCLRAGGALLRGRVFFRGNGLKSGAYQEMSSALAYERKLPSSLKTRMEVQMDQISIRDYGTAWSQQFNARVEWAYRPDIRLALTWSNLTGAGFGEGHYPLPKRLALGGTVSAAKRLQFFLELESDSRYALATRFGLGYSPLERITLLGGLQSNPGIASAGISALIGTVRASAAYQYHPDLGFSQCYGLALGF